MSPRDAEAPTAHANGPASDDASPSSQPRYRRLRLWNAVMAVLHFVQGAAMLVLAERVLWPVTRTRFEFDPATETIAPVSVEWAEVQLPLLVAGFLLVSAIAHMYIATVGYESYVAHLQQEINPYRWYEYAVSASLMIVVIAMLAGIWDVGTLLALFALVAVMNLMGLVMERYNDRSGDVDWTPYIVGSLAGAVPWIAIAVALWGSVTASGGDVPEFVLYIFVSLFVFFNLFAVTMVVQYRQTWRFEEYLVGEKTYILLSLVAKSALAWQVYFGTQTSPI